MAYPMNLERNEKVVQLFKDGHRKSDIAGMVGLSRQRVCKIIDTYYPLKKQDGEKEMSDFQLSRIQTVIFPHVREYMIENNITVSQFCQSVSSGSKTINGTYNFLVGKAKIISIDTMNQILDKLGLSYEEVFRKDVDV